MNRNAILNKIKVSLNDNNSIKVHFVNDEGELYNYRFYKKDDEIFFDSDPIETEGEPTSFQDIQDLILSTDVAGEWELGWLSITGLSYQALRENE